MKDLQRCPNNFLYDRVAEPFLTFGKDNIFHSPLSPLVTLLYPYLGVAGPSYENKLCDLFRTNIDT